MKLFFNKIKNIFKSLRIKMINKKINYQYQSTNQQRLLTRRNNKLNDYLHKANRLISNHCANNNISKVVIGDMSKSYNSINIGKKNFPNSLNISVDYLICKIKYKLEKHQIKVMITNEMYTSKA